MAYQTRCPECQAKLILDETPSAGEAVECPKCGNQFTPGQSKGKGKPDRTEKKAGKKGADAPKQKSTKKPNESQNNAVKKRKTKKKKSNPYILYLMAAGALIILAAVGGIGYFLFGRTNKMEEMMMHVSSDFNLVRGLNVNYISKVPGYQPELDQQLSRGLREVVTDLAAAAGNNDFMTFVDFVVHAKKKQGGLAGQIIIIRTREAIDSKTVGAQIGAESNADGISYYRSNGRGLMANAIVYSPNNRLLIVVPAGGQQEAVFRASLNGPKAREGTIAGVYGEAGKRITRGHIWTLVQATGDLQNYVKQMGDGVKKDFPPLGTELGKTKFFGTWLTFSQYVRVGAAIQCESKDTASSIATSLTEGPLGKGDDSEVPNETKKVLPFAGAKEFKEQFLANIKYTYTGDCAYLESRLIYAKATSIIRYFNNPAMADQ